MKQAQRYTLGKKERIKSRKTIERIFAEGRSFSHFPFRVSWVEEPGMMPVEPGTKHGEAVRGNDESAALGVEALQAAFSVPRRHFRRSVQRNRIKRLMREAWRLQKGPLQEMLRQHNRQLRVFLIYVGKEVPEGEPVREKTQGVLQRLQKMIHEKPADHP